jgi:putative transposase
VAGILVQVKIRVFNFNQTKIHMKKTRFTEVQIIGILNEQEQGMKLSNLYRKHGISEATFYNCKSKYGGMKVDELKRLRELEEEKNVELTTSFSIIEILSGEPIPGRLLLSSAYFRFGSTMQNSNQQTIFTTRQNSQPLSKPN